MAAIQMIVVPGSASRRLSSELAKVSSSPLAKIESRRFPDGECYVRLQTDLSEEHVIIVQSTYPDTNFVELLLMVDAVREFDVEKLTVVVPYYGYARQDKKFKDGEGISARAMARHLSLCADSVVAVELHAPSIMQWFNVPIKNISGVPPIAEILKKEEVDMVLSPDKGALERASIAAEIIGCDWDHLEKTRIDGERVVMKTKNLDVKGKRVAIVDDIIATGGTMITAAAHLREQGASGVLAACTHGLYTGNALPRITAAFDMVISTDTLETETSIVSMAGEVARVL